MAAVKNLNPKAEVLARGAALFMNINAGGRGARRAAAALGAAPA